MTKSLNKSRKVSENGNSRISEEEILAAAAQGNGSEHENGNGVAGKSRGKKNERVERLVVPELRIGLVIARIVGTAPLMQLRFSQKAIEKMKTVQEAGTVAKNKKVREPRKFEEDCELAKHKMLFKGKEVVGLPAPAFRNAMIRACSLVGFKMTLAKLSIFVEADGLDTVDGVPLVRLNPELCCEPEMTIMPVRNANGSADLRARPQWKEWGVDLRIRYDMDQFTKNDVVNLLNRAGQQVGIGEGRHGSRESSGMGFGTFQIDYDHVELVELKEAPKK